MKRKKQGKNRLGEMKSKILGILITLLFVAGYATLNYPVLGTLYNQIREGKVIDSYDHAVHTMNKEKLQKYLEDAQKYNEMLARENPQLSDAFSQEEKKSDSAYNSFGYGRKRSQGALEIPKISAISSHLSWNFAGSTGKGNWAS